MTTPQQISIWLSLNVPKEILERISIGRRFKNDTGRLEKMFEIHSRMTERYA
jgi:hypothetical protein